MNATREIDKALFDAAVGIEDAGLRRAFLDETCQGDAARRARLGRLIEAHEEADAFLEVAAEARVLPLRELAEVAPLPESDRETGDEAVGEGPGAHIGRYRLLERIGEGGCGVVWLAEQQEPVQRRVALKVIRLGMDTENVIARFEIERQALAMMDHPNIAHVLDAGATETGRPYFVMEWVRGSRITTYCDDQRLTIRQRIELFIQVCHAVQHAHQKGVIHRDIKPSNILVGIHDGKPVPKVIDFGIAKATERNLFGRVLATNCEQWLGTPAYMSPEQADEKVLDVDTRSDVYSLGILLYELLAGLTPFDPKELAAVGMSQARKIITGREPLGPSAALARMARNDFADVAARRAAEPVKFVSALQGDLDWIVLKAIEKDRQRRYETVNGLARDLQRFLREEPVLARPPSRLYQLRKLVRRNRAAFISGALVVISLVAGLGIAVNMYFREGVALRDQQRLRSLAEAARAEELLLRRQTEARENLSIAAVLLSQARVGEADALLRLTPVSSIEPCRASAEVLRALGEWSAIYERWPEAAKCFDMLTQANRYIGDHDICNTGDLIRPAPAMIEAGDIKLYEKHRAELVERFSGTKEMNTIEQMLKVCLLTPPEPRLLERLTPAANLLERKVIDEKQVLPYEQWKAWSMMSLALFEYRSGNPAKAITLAELGLEAGQKNHLSRDATLHAVIAMACKSGGNPARMEQELATAAEELARLIPVTNGSFDVDAHSWHDRSIARILLREAQTTATANRTDQPGQGTAPERALAR